MTTYAPGNMSTPSDAEMETEVIEFGVKVYTIISLFLVGVTGTVGNGLTLVALATTKKLQTLPNMYIANLAVTDLAVCSILAPLTLVGIFSGGPPPGCDIHAYPTMILLIVSMVTLTAIAYNRYVLITKSKQYYMKLYNRSRMVASLAGIWLISSVFLVLPSFGIGQLGYNTKFGACLMIADDTMTYVMMQLIHGLVVFPAMALLLFCYVRMGQTFRQSQRRVAGAALPTQHKTDEFVQSSNKGATGEPSPSKQEAINESPLSNQRETNSKPSTSNRREATNDLSPSANVKSDNEASPSNQQETKKDPSPPNRRAAWSEVSSTNQRKSNNVSSSINPQNERPNNEAQTKKHSSQQKQTIRVIFNLFIVFCTFSVCWLPLIGTYTIDYRQRLSANVYHVLVTIAYSNSAINPLLYSGLNKNFRRAFSRILTCGRVQQDF